MRNSLISHCRLWEDTKLISGKMNLIQLKEIKIARNLDIFINIIIIISIDTVSVFVERATNGMIKDSRADVCACRAQLAPDPNGKIQRDKSAYRRTSRIFHRFNRLLFILLSAASLLSFYSNLCSASKAHEKSIWYASDGIEPCTRRGQKYAIWIKMMHCSESSANAFFVCEFTCVVVFL